MHGRSRALRRDFARHVDLVQMLRLMAAASPEFASVAFACEASDFGAHRRPTSHRPSPTDPKPARGANVDSSSRPCDPSPIALPDLEASVVRLPLRPTCAPPHEASGTAKSLRRLIFRIVGSSDCVDSRG